MPVATNYRADHVGSLLRPAEVLQARAEHIQGRLTLEQLRAIEDQAILSALEMQRQVGIDIISDGEFRRSWFSGGIAEAVKGSSTTPTRLILAGGKVGTNSWPTLPLKV